MESVSYSEILLNLLLLKPFVLERNMSSMMTYGITSNATPLFLIYLNMKIYILLSICVRSCCNDHCNYVVSNFVIEKRMS
jgi:hypothetical protein